MQCRTMIVVFVLATWACVADAAGAETRPAARTFCNPLNLDYARGQAEARHAADPVIVPFKGKYYLFTTNDLAGYRVSSDLIHWEDILFDPSILPRVAEGRGLYTAPAVATDGEFLYFIKFNLRRNEKTVAVMRTREPLSGKWEECGRIRTVKDPCLFIDDDGRCYMYYGLGGPTNCFEIDKKTFTEIPGTDRQLRPRVKDVAELAGGYERGRREVYGELDTRAFLDKFKILPCQEGAWMTKHGGRYYLQYATPGTVCQWYADAVMEGPSPMGPFKYADYAPASMKAGGFIGSAGHSCVFQDFHGNWWRVTTMWVGVDGDFERRIGLFPVGFDARGRMYTETALGDLPQVMPAEARGAQASPLAGWWVQSYGKKVTASSSLDGHGPELAADENVRTWWSAASGNAGEWLQMDLGKVARVNAVQVNFAEQDCKKDPESLARDFHQYKLLASEDGKTWRMLADRSEGRRCAPHDYIQLNAPQRVRFLKVENVHMAKAAKFAIRDLRIFGDGGGQAPARVEEFKATRHADDGRNVTFTWRPVPGADGYLIRYGVAPDALYQCLQVQGGGQASLTVHTLNRGVKYWYRIVAFNDSGLTPGADPAAPETAAGPELEREFKNPPLASKSLPLWHLNGQLTTAEIKAQLTDSRDKSGFAGVAVLPVSETKPKYLSEEYFARYGDILETCKTLGLKVVFYDDINFPSGSAGGLMKDRFPQDLACRLDNEETDLTGPQAWARALPRGMFMGAVAMNTQTLERRDISGGARDGRIAWQVPAGPWKIMLFTCVRSGGGVDYLCPKSIDKFFSLTYDQYYKHFAPHFGSTIFMTFFDDVGVRGGERRTWTPAFNEKFQQKYGFSPVPLYPALWHNIGPDTAAARVALFDLRAELMAEGYPRKVHEWAAAHGIQSSGHAMGQYHPQPALLGGDHIKFYRHSDIPMIDSIHYYGHGRPGFKLTSSAAWSYDRPLTAVEIYGNYRAFDPPMLYRSGMELFARGANLLLPHAMWYNPQKVRIKPLISHFDPKVGPVLPEYNNWVGRASLLLQGGRHVADIGMLYPVAAMEAFARLDAVVDQPRKKGNTHPGLYVPPQCDFNELSDKLTGEIRRDFTFLHPEILNERCLVNGPVLRLNNKTNYEEYRVLVIPGGRVIHWSNLQKIKEFYDGGGKVIATTLLPCQSAEFGRDRAVVETVRALFGVDPEKPAPAVPFSKRTNGAGGAAYFVPSLSGAALASALDDAAPAADVRFEDRGPAVAPDKGMLSYLHKVKDGRNIYFIANSSDEPVDTWVKLRGNLKLQLWNPHDGTITPADARGTHEQGQDFTRARLQLKPIQSAFLVAPERQGAL